MTLSVAWVRHAGSNQELVFASDSRLTGGGNVDECQKVFSLPREDCCISFSGETTIAYPFIHQLQNVTEDYKKFLDRAIDIIEFKKSAIYLLNKFVGAHKDVVQGGFESDLIKTHFLLGGWSWKNSKFYIWRIQFESSSKRYVAVSATTNKQLSLDRLQNPLMAVIGDYRHDFVKRLREACRDVLPIGRALVLGYQPLFTLTEMLLEEEFTLRRLPKKGLIGGAPQVTKVHKFMKTSNYAVKWRENDHIVYAIKGRVLDNYETFSILAIDPITGGLTLPRTFAELSHLSRRVSDEIDDSELGLAKDGFSPVF